jgi:phytoene synthase
MTATPDILVLDGAASSFHYSFSFLPRPQRKALETVYAFCRATDDLVDNQDAVQSDMERLTKWRLERPLSGRRSSISSSTNSTR